MTKRKSTSTSLQFCGYCGAAHADDISCPVCELMETLMLAGELPAHEDISGVPV